MSTSVLIFIFLPSVVFALPSRTAQPKIQQDSIASPRNAIPMISNEERQDLCQICQRFTSEKPLECKSYCAKFLKGKTSPPKSGSYSRKKPTTLGDALCDFCKKYPKFRISEMCKKKLCSK